MNVESRWEDNYRYHESKRVIRSLFQPLTLEILLHLAKNIELKVKPGSKNIITTPCTYPTPVQLPSDSVCAVIDVAGSNSRLHLVKTDNTGHPSSTNPSNYEYGMELDHFESETHFWDTLIKPHLADLNNLHLDGVALVCALPSSDDTFTGNRYEKYLTPGVKNKRVTTPPITFPLAAGAYEYLIENGICFNPKARHPIVLDDTASMSHCQLMEQPGINIVIGTGFGLSVTLTKGARVLGVFALPVDPAIDSVNSIDSQTQNIQSGQVEKAVAGNFLGKYIRYGLEELKKNGLFMDEPEKFSRTSLFNHYLKDPPEFPETWDLVTCASVRTLARVIRDQSAKIAGMVVGSVANTWLATEPVIRLLAEGSVIGKMPGYKPIVEKTAALICRRPVTIDYQPTSIPIGAARILFGQKR